LRINGGGVWAEENKTIASEIKEKREMMASTFQRGEDQHLGIMRKGGCLKLI